MSLKYEPWGSGSALHREYVEFLERYAKFRARELTTAATKREERLRQAAAGEQQVFVCDQIMLVL